MKATNSKEKAVETVCEVIQKIAIGDFSAKVPLSDRADAFDAIAMGINMLGEEIQAYRIEKEEHERDLTSMLEDLEKAKEESEKAREELKESEERFRRIAETSIDFIFQIDKKGEFLYCSPSVENVLGLKPEEIAGTNLQDYFMPSDFMKAFDRFKEVLSGRNVGLFDMTLLNNRGASVQLELSAVPIVKNDEIIGLQGIARDITEYKKTERELKEREELYSSLTQAVVDAIITIGDEGKVTYWNEGAERIFGYAANEAVGRVATELLVPEPFRAKMDEEFEKFTETGEGALINNITEAVAQRKNGSEFPMELSVAPVKIKGKWQAVGVARDVTERKQAEEELKKWSHDLGERVKELNCLYQISQLVERADTSKEVVLQGIVEIIPPSWQYPDITCARIVLSDEEYTTSNFRETEWMQTSAISLNEESIGSVEVYYLEETMEEDEGPFLSEEKSLIDAISKEVGRMIERKRMEENLEKYTENLEKEIKERTNEVIQSEKMSSLGQLVAGVAHEINNPMAYLKTNTEFLEDDLRDMEKICGEKGQPIFEEMKELISSNLEGIGRVTTITKTLKRFARPDEKGKTISDINEGLKDTLVIVHNRLKHRIHVHEDYREIPKVACNVGQLNQVFMNLIMNSSQAMEEGDIWLKTWSDEENVYVQVRDNGKGIPENKLREVFNPFFTTKADGTGLGLSLSYRIIQAHGGDIIAESEIDKGTKMTVKIPREVRE